MFQVMGLILSFLVMAIFLLTSSKKKWEKDSMVSFECGFSPSFESRFSFSMHFFTVGLIFLFLDLELCLIMPFMNESFSSTKMIMLGWMFMVFLLTGLIYEWNSNELSWKF